MFLGSENGCKLSLKIDEKHDVLAFFLPEDKIKTQLSISRRACKVAGDVSLPI